MQLTVHCIELIRLLKRYAKACERQLAEDFIHGLVSSARLLEEVRMLCIRVEKHGIPILAR